MFCGIPTTVDAATRRHPSIVVTSGREGLVIVKLRN
jgi:hypothetical protein